MDANHIITSVSFLQIGDLQTYTENEDGTVSLSLKPNRTVYGLEIESESVSFDEPENELDEGQIFEQSLSCVVAFDQLIDVIPNGDASTRYIDISGKRGVLLYKYQNGTQKSIGTDRIPGRLSIRTSSSGFSTQLQITFTVSGINAAPITTVV